MKTKRILAAILSALMLMSCVSFTVGATEEPVDGEISLFDFLGEEGTAAIEEAEEAVDESEEVVDDVEETVDEPEEVVDDVEETVEESEEPSEKSTKKTSKKVEAEEEASLMEEAELAAEGNTVYLSSSVEGSADTNDGLTPEKPVKTLAKAAAILAANSDSEKFGTIVVVGTYEKKYEAGAATNRFGETYGKQIIITGGNNPDAVFDMRYYKKDTAGAFTSEKVDSHLRIGTDVEFNNIKIRGSEKDGGIMSMGYHLTFGDNVTNQANQNIGFSHYDEQYKDFGVIDINSGTFSKVDIGVQSGVTYRGTATLNISGTANTKIYNGHGWKGSQNVYGITKVNITDGNVTSISLSSTADTGVTNYSGLRYFTIDGGTVGSVDTTGSSVSKIYETNKCQTASVRAGITVIEYNGGTINSIGLGKNKQTGDYDPDAATRVVILNNKKDIDVNDGGAIVVKSNGTLHAVTTAYDENGDPTYGDYTKLTADWGKELELEGFSYETTAPYIKITHEGEQDIYLSSNAPEGAPAKQLPTEVSLAAEGEIYTGTIPAKYFALGTYEVSFVDDAMAAVTFVTEDGTSNELQNIGKTVTFPPDPTKTGYSFKGWATVENSTDVVVKADEKVAYAGNTYYAVFEINQYTITFENTGDTTIDPIKQDYATAVTAPANPEKKGYKFAGWDNVIPAKMPAENMTINAKWDIYYEAPNTVYLSDDGDDANHGFHSALPVKNMKKANELLALDGKDTLVIVGTYTICKDQAYGYGKEEFIGVADKTITIKGYKDDAVFCMDRKWDMPNSITTTKPEYDDAKTSMVGPVVFTNIKLAGENNDGYLITNGHKLVMESSVTRSGNTKDVRVFPGNIGLATSNEVVLKGGYNRFNVAGTSTGAKVKNFTKLTVDGAHMVLIGLGKGNNGNPNYFGKFYVNVENGTVDKITMQSDGTNAENGYMGIRYFTLNGGIVKSITTTAGSQAKAGVAVANRTGATVFEINKESVLTGNISLGVNKVTKQPEADNATRIILFNNNSYASYKGTNNDTTAITVNVINGALQADVTMAADYTTTLKGYTYETSAPYIKITTPDNKTIYLDAKNPDGTPAATIPEGATLLADETNEGTIPANYLVAGVNEVEFVNSDKTKSAVKFVVEGEAKYQYQAIDGAVSFPAEDPTKTGYRFKGWATTENGAVVDTATETVAYAGNTYYAVFEINQYTITFNTDGGTEIAPIKQDYDTTVTAPAAPTKTGYTFAGWDNDIPATIPAENITITALWTINQYTITFITDGTAVAPITQDYATAVTAPTTEKTGYTFTGWSPAVPENMPAEDMTVTAQWQINQYTITFANTGDTTIAPIKQDYATAVTAPAAPLKTGYTFAGWDREIPATIPAENITITALWTINQYTITFANTGDTTIDPIKQDYATSVNAPADPAKLGYTFAGWDKTIPEAMPAEDMTITAQWTANDVGYVLKTYMMDKNGETYTLTETTVPAGNSGAITDSPFTYTPAAVEGFTLNTQKSVLTDDAVNADGTTLIELYYDRNVITIYYTVAGQTIEQVVKNDQLIDEDHHFDVEIKLPVLPDEVLDEIYEHQHNGQSRKGYKFYWKKLDAVSGHLLEERNEALESNVYYLPGDNFTVPSEPVEFTAYWDYSGAELVLAPNASKAVANDHEFVFDIYLESAYSETLTDFESGEFTLDITTKDNTSYTYELTPNANITFEPDLDGRILVKRTDGNAAYLVPEKAPNGTDYRIYLGAVKVTGAGEGTVTLSKAVGYRHVIDGTDADHLAVEFLVKDASESYTVEVPTATLKVTVDFKNIVTDNVHEYQDMTMTISGGDLGEEIVIDLGKNASFAVPDLANRDGEAITAPALADGKYVVTLTNILAVNRTYNIKLEGAGYRSTRYTVSMTADKELYFWNNVMDNVTEIEAGKPGTQVTFLAGDIVKDSEINIYDLSAVVSYFGEIDLNKAGTQSAYTKYDLNRDGKIDSKDVAYVLVSWGK